MMTKDFEHIARVASDSAQARLVGGAWRIAHQAWQHSRLRSALVHTTRYFGARSITERVRLTASVVAVAAVTNVLARGIIPPYTAPRLPVTAILVLAIVAAAVAAAPDAFVTAWRASRFSRSKQR